MDRAGGSPRGTEVEEEMQKEPHGKDTGQQVAARFTCRNRVFLNPRHIKKAKTSPNDMWIDRISRGGSGIDNTHKRR